MSELALGFTVPKVFMDTSIASTIRDLATEAGVPNIGNTLTGAGTLAGRSIFTAMKCALNTDTIMAITMASTKIITTMGMTMTMAMVTVTGTDTITMTTMAEDMGTTKAA